MATTATPTQKPAAVPKLSNKPIAKRQFGNISVAVFGREVSRPDGTVFTAKDYVLQKSWKDKNDVWQNHSISFLPREILAVQQALVMAFVDSHENGDDEE
jgi:hypothetical protein